jgi:rhodanese-related sulfurtransferase
MLEKLFGRKPAGAVAQLRVEELRHKLLDKEALQLIDVRSAEEYKHDGHIAGARLIPLPALAQRLGEIAHTTPVVVICRSGNRSQTAATLLAQAGYSNVSNLQGGMIAWRSAGFPTS